MTSSSTCLPLLYSFRRCPYAIRTRLALWYAEQDVQIHEVSLRDKPAALLAISPKATVPVLQLSDGRVLEESLDIMLWALGQHDPHALLPSGAMQGDVFALIAANDGEFKHWLDRYKYAVRYPEHRVEDYREQGEVFLAGLEQRLGQAAYLGGSQVGLADVAIMPFVRQFAFVDKAWFDAADYPAVQKWLARWLTSEVFVAVMAVSRPESE